MKKRLLVTAIGALTAASAQAQAPAAKAPAAPPIEVRLSGQINRAIMHVDDGAEKEWFNVDNGNSSTRFRFNAEGQVTPTQKAGILFEVEFKSNPSSDVTFANRSIPPELNERHMDVFYASTWGTLRLGQGDGAANGASEVDLSGTTVAHYASTPDIGGAFQYRTNGLLSGASIAGTLSNQDFESRYDRVLYQTPSMSGFTVEGSWGNKQSTIYELALRYSGKLESLGTLAAALGYSTEEGTGGGADDKTLGGSISWLHTSGINLTYSHTNRELPGRDGKFDYFKLGYKFSSLHAVSIDYAMGQDQLLGGDEATMFGIGYVLTPIAWAEVFALFKQHSLDRSGGSLDDIQFFMVGSRIKF
jgi:Gram-negative porin